MKLKLTGRKVIISNKDTGSLEGLYSKVQVLYAAEASDYNEGDFVLVGSDNHNNFPLFSYNGVEGKFVLNSDLGILCKIEE